MAVSPRCRVLQCAVHETLLHRKLVTYSDVLIFTAIMMPSLQLVMFPYGVVTYI
jgi:hypothetical protein